jgi:alanyl-tRNA synthetase
MNPVFRTQSYQQELSATVHTVTLHDGQTAVACQDLILYPGGGGQPPDEGILVVRGQTFPVMGYVKHRGDVSLLLKDKVPFHDDLAKGEPVQQIVLWERRYAAMRLHTAQHALGAAARIILPNYATRGMTISDDVRCCVMRFTARSVTESQVEEMKDLIRAAITADLSVVARTFKSIEAAREEFGSALRVDARLSEFKGNVRVIIIGTNSTDSPLCDASPCGGTHLRSLREVGLLEIADLSFIDEAGEWQLEFVWKESDGD